MRRRDFLARTGAVATASVLLENVRFDGPRFADLAFAASDGDGQKATLEQKFAEFGLSIRYEVCLRTLSPQPNASFSIRSDAHSDP